MCLWFGAKRDGLCPISLRADNLDNDPTHLKVPRVFFAAWLSSVISVKSRREFEWAGENGKKQKKNSWFSLSKLPHINMGDASRWQKQFRWDHRVELKQTQSLIALPLVEWRMSLWREMANEKTCKCWKDFKMEHDEMGRFWNGERWRSGRNKRFWQFLCVPILSDSGGAVRSAKCVRKPIF